MTFFTQREDMENWLFEHRIDNYTFTSDMKVRVQGDVNLSDKKLTTIPVEFERVEGDFLINNNSLKSLKGSPRYVAGRFDCRDNQLENLCHSPQKVMGEFNCNNNHITSLKGGPLFVRGSFACCGNHIASLEGAPEFVGSNFHCYKNKIKTLKGFKTQFNPGTWSLFCDRKIVELQEFFQAQIDSGKIAKKYQNPELGGHISIVKLQIILEKNQLNQAVEILPSHASLSDKKIKTPLKI